LEEKNLSVEFDSLQKVACDVHEQLYATVGPNICYVSERHMAILVTDRRGNVVFMWSKNLGF